ncbi:MULTISPECIES: hypothetical protein [Actinomadura]|uniref:Uncharacterized protein n=1 Tax=Actinomadura yumaensis TaxID=111807 RepID=A0ABW2CH18_9ACTN|nr:hypothetical protein [Actinomadura sp. J1-007]MWK34598.1 hypothetical protein [Actinomadura sp. J1-007]
MAVTRKAGGLGRLSMAKPCRALDFTHQFKWLYLEMLYEEITHKDGCLRGKVEPDNGLLYMVGLLNFLNRQTGEVFVSRRRLGEDMGIHSNGAPLKAALDAYLEHGFLVKKGHRNRTDLLAVTFPEALRGKYPDLEDAVMGPLLNPPPAAPASGGASAATDSFADPFVPDDERGPKADPFADPFAL